MYTAKHRYKYVPSQQNPLVVAVLADVAGGYHYRRRGWKKDGRLAVRTWGSVRSFPCCPKNDIPLSLALGRQRTHRRAQILILK